MVDRDWCARTVPHARGASGPSFPRLETTLLVPSASDPNLANVPCPRREMGHLAAWVLPIPSSRLFKDRTDHYVLTVPGTHTAINPRERQNHPRMTQYCGRWGFVRPPCREESRRTLASSRVSWALALCLGIVRAQIPTDLFANAHKKTERLRVARDPTYR